MFVDHTHATQSANAHVSAAPCRGRQPTRPAKSPCGGDRAAEQAPHQRTGPVLKQACSLQRGGSGLQLGEAATGVGEQDGFRQAEGAGLLGDGAARAAPGDDQILHQVAVDAQLLAAVENKSTTCENE